MQQRIIYIINPIAGTRTKKDLQQFIQEKKETFYPFITFMMFIEIDFLCFHTT